MSAAAGRRRLGCGNDPGHPLTGCDRAVLAWYRDWLTWSAQPPDERGDEPTPPVHNPGFRGCHEETPMTVRSFRKKPVVIQAVQFTEENCHAVRDWVVGGGGDAIVTHPLELNAPNERTTQLAILTLEGKMRADLGDWVIQGVKGEFYPCKPDIFADTYEPAEETP